ncbi:GNAT family N-acetyltransferase [Bacillus sp. AFS076308]|uniref:GNAT family N-acetyltransferase n=1 Tax=unclassified Bacillus (in: firmicutes) TaxID=185979 RepID=UPI000BF31510|nr:MULTISPECIES: GNAT family N-acetyltransferase [unclassified Bacillus (in: firmicutes)]PFN99664.1 GNAT family N-acetyltransferase [Bacillus sp. AFS076308]PGV50158.1 GNAT family N-acetyltransferase [Bacillus sp. AFS037270]
MFIRDAVVKEMPLIREQRIDAYEIHANSIPEGHWRALKQAISSDEDTNPNIERIVAELDGKIVGSVVLYPAKTDAYEGNVEKLDYPEIRMLAVAPDAQGKGIATRLISECIIRAKAKGCQAVGLHTGEFMTGAMRLYEQLGFERTPQYDFVPANDGIIVKAYLLNFDKKI